MNWITIKKPTDLKLDGVRFECEYRDKTLAAVTMTDEAGHALRFVLESYSVRAMVPAPPERETKHVVSGTVRGVGAPIREVFDTASEASDRRDEIVRADVCDTVTLTTEEIECPF